MIEDLPLRLSTHQMHTRAFEQQRAREEEAQRALTAPGPVTVVVNSPRKMSKRKRK